MGASAAKDDNAIVDGSAVVAVEGEESEYEMVEEEGEDEMDEMVDATLKAVNAETSSLPEVKKKRMVRRKKKKATE